MYLCAREARAHLFAMHVGSDFGSGKTKGATRKRLGSCAMAERARNKSFGGLAKVSIKSLGLVRARSHKDKSQSPK